MRFQMIAARRDDYCSMPPLRFSRRTPLNLFALAATAAATMSRVARPRALACSSGAYRRRHSSKVADIYISPADDAGQIFGEMRLRRLHTSFISSIS